MLIAARTREGSYPDRFKSCRAVLLAPRAPATIFGALAEGGMGSGVTRFLLLPVRRSQAAAVPPSSAWQGYCNAEERLSNVYDSLFSSEQASDKVRP
jgi:hypothetical protein